MTGDAAKSLLYQLQQSVKAMLPDKLGKIGRDCYPGMPGYAKTSGVAIERPGGHVPYVLEAKVSCGKIEKRSESDTEFLLAINRSATLAKIYSQYSDGVFYLSGCGLAQAKVAAASGTYTVLVSLITPHLGLSNDGKSPDLGPYRDAIVKVVSEAMRSAHRQMHRPKKISIKAALWSCALEAYRKASGDGQFPPSSRQVFYQARPMILELIKADNLVAHYITQNLLPDFEEQHPEETANWDITYDARGHFIEPHTDREVGLGTTEVREYLDEMEEKVSQGPTIQLAGHAVWHTVGPQFRYRAALFIEKEGFNPLLQQAKIAERFDLAVLSTKGMSNTATRKLLDELAGSGEVDRILVAHDFDVSGFDIFHTLANPTRRYQYENEVQFVDIGLRLSDIHEMGLQPEPVVVKEWDATKRRLLSRGVRPDEVKFLRSHRVELNAMSAPQLVSWLEQKLVAHAVEKVIPPLDIMREHARRILARREADKILATLPEFVLPELALDDLEAEVRELLRDRPALSWDLAVTAIMSQS